MKTCLNAPIKEPLPTPKLHKNERIDLVFEMERVFSSATDDFFEGFLPGFFDVDKGRIRGKDLYFEAILSPGEAVEGGLFPITVPVIEPCPKCGKTGAWENFFCPVCSGYGAEVVSTYRTCDVFGAWLDGAFEKLSTTRPKPPETREPMMIPSFESSVNSPLTKDRPEINRDMVKPMPPRVPAPRIWIHFTPKGRGAFSVFVAN